MNSKGDWINVGKAYVICERGIKNYCEEQPLFMGSHDSKFMLESTYSTDIRYRAGMSIK